MSADNGVYILKTTGDKGTYEYRVRELQAVENVYWNARTGRDSTSHDIWIKNARRMWKDAPVFPHEDVALNAALEIYKRLSVCEYGIATITIERRF